MVSVCTYSSSSGASVCTVKLAPEKSSKDSAPVSPPSSTNTHDFPVIVLAEKKVSLSQPAQLDEKKADISPTPSRNKIEEIEICTDVKKVRALFERNASGEQNCFFKKKLGNTLSSGNNNNSSNESNLRTTGSGYFRKSSLEQEKQGSHQNHKNIPTQQQPLGRSCSSFNLQQTQHGSVANKLLDFGDLLVNDKVVIEESPDIFQASRQRYVRFILWITNYMDIAY